MDPTPPRRSPRAQMRIYLIALALYLCLIYLPFVRMPELHAQVSTERLPRLMAQLLSGKAQMWGLAPVWWRLQNYALLYLCSACVFGLTRKLVPKPLWLSSFAAVLFMANPAKGPSIYAQEGIVYWLPQLCTLAGLLSYVHACIQQNRVYYLASLVVLALGCTLSASVYLVLWPLLLFHLIYGRRRHWILLMAAALVTTASVWASQQTLALSLTSHPGGLLLIMYPLGYLPRTTALFLDYPWLEWALLLVYVALAAVIYRKVRHPAMLWGLGSAALVYLTGGANPNLVTLAGGEVLLLPMALTHVGLAAVICAIFQHPKWRKPMVLLTALWCLVYFVLQLRAALQWWPA